MLTTKVTISIDKIDVFGRNWTLQIRTEYYTSISF